jgi:hypothetical protein
MFDSIKEKIAEIVVEKQLKNKREGSHTFTGFFGKAFTFFVAMPEDDHDFNHSLIVLNFLADSKKSVIVLTRDFKVSLLPAKYRAKAIEYNFKDISKWKLPSQRLIDKLSEMQFNASIDLNRKENLFYSLSANLVQAPLRIGFAKSDSDKFYNLQVVNGEDNPEISYKNFLNCLQMFQE